MSTDLTLHSAGRNMDSGFLAIADLVELATALEIEYRIVGGMAIALLVRAHAVESLVPDRETADADFGAEPEVLGDERFVPALLDRGYEQVGGNRFSKTITHDSTELDLVIDVLAPNYSACLTPNQEIGSLVVDGVPGLKLALAREPLLLDLSVELTDGSSLRYPVPLPDPIPALCMKAFSYAGRYEQRDALDVWRLLEVCYAAGVRKSNWPNRASAKNAAELLHRHFGRPGAGGTKNATSDRAAQARIPALVTEVVGVSA